MPARCCAIFSWRSGPSPASRPTIWLSSARASGRSSPRASSAGSASTKPTSWWEFVGAEQRSAAYQKFLAAGITRSLVAAKARKASTRTIGDVFVQLMLTILNPTAGSTDRVLDGPTNLVWIDPWRAYLEFQRVRAVRHATQRSRRSCATRDESPASPFSQQGKRAVVRGDYYIAALPLERIAPLVNGRLLAADPTLANLRALAPNVEWMNGVQFYLRRDLPTAHGHVIHIDTEWALTSISQLQFWRDMPPEFLGDSDVHSVLSVDVSDWTRPGIRRTPRHGSARVKRWCARRGASSSDR